MVKPNIEPIPGFLPSNTKHYRGDLFSHVPIKDKLIKLLQNVSWNKFIRRFLLYCISSEITYKPVFEIIMHSTNILEVAKQVRIKSIRETFLLLIQSIQLTRTMNPFPKIPSKNSPAEMIVSILFNVLSMPTDRKSLPSVLHWLINEALQIYAFKALMFNKFLFPVL